MLFPTALVAVFLVQTFFLKGWFAVAIQKNGLSLALQVFSFFVGVATEWDQKTVISRVP